MTDMRRTLLWVVFTMSLVLLWDAWNRHTGQPSLFGGPPPAVQAPAPAPPPPADPAQAAVPAAGVPAPAVTAPAAGVPAPAVVTAPAAPGVPAPAAAAPATELVTLTTDVLRLSFDSRGGDLVRAELLQHRHQVYHDERNVLLFDRSAERLYVAQTGLISAQAGVMLPNHLTPMSVVPGPRELAEGRDTLQLRFESPDVGGSRVVKTYTIRRGEHTLRVRHEVVNTSDQTIEPQLYLQLARDGNPAPGESWLYFTFTGPALFTEAGKFRQVPFEDIRAGRAEHDRAADNGWISMVEHYFASAWLLPPGTPREFRTARVSENFYSIAMVVPLGQVAAGASRVHESTLFVGPLEERRLAALAPGLDLLKDYGWFTILSKPLFWLLYELNSIIGNWGWSIVALVVLLKIAFYWLNAAAYRSMAKMKAISPRMMEMRERLKDKPQLLQQEMMKLYREEKINPLGGCLPILVQMPFFIALYWVLLASVEMRDAPWILWIDDLSAIDPYFILPILMTVSMLFQTWLNPTPPDPMQAKLMWIMPMVFSVFFFFFPAGLVLYWLTNNILSIAQQWYMNKKLGVYK
jgi:YidC/Oxa1 family membrane protein insertase